MNTPEEKRQEIQELREKISALEQDLFTEAADRWRGGGFYTAYYATAGFFLGMIAAAVSLALNIVGAWASGMPTLKLIQVYLTFPLGEKALELNDGMTLTIGCCLYMGTGMIFGMLIHLILTRIAHGSPNYPLLKRLMASTVIGLGLWLVNFYGVLYWLQPLLFGGRWIVDLIPPWVAAGTHLVFAWTMALVYPLGVYLPYRLQSEQA